MAVLRLHCTEGRITLDEFSDRVGNVYNARTAGELDAVVADLPVPWSEDAPACEDDDDEDRFFESSRPTGPFRPLAGGHLLELEPAGTVHARRRGSRRGRLR